MRRTWIAAGLGAVALCAAAFAYVASPRGDAAKGDAAARLPTVARSAIPPAGPQDPAASAQVDALLADESVAARRQLLSLYTAWIGQDDKRSARERILAALLADEDRKRGLKRLLEAVAADDTPIDDDPLFAFAAQQLQRQWRDPALFRYGRDLMLVQRSDKTRALLGESLVAHAAALDDVSDPEAQTRTLLASDMVDAYFDAGEESRDRLLSGAGKLGGKDIVRALDEHERDTARFDTVRHEAGQAHAAIQDMHDELSGTDDPELEGLMPKLSELADLDARELLRKIADE